MVCRTLSDADITITVSDKNTAAVQHALLQIRNGSRARRCHARRGIPTSSAAAIRTRFRLTAAWVMGFDTRLTSSQSLAGLLKDSEPIVRRNAALALLRFGDASGRDELRTILQPYSVTSPTGGVVESTLKEQSPIARGSLLVRLRQPNNLLAEVRSPLPGRVERIALAPGSTINAGATLLTLSSDEESIWEALRVLQSW